MTKYAVLYFNDAEEAKKLNDNTYVGIYNTTNDAELQAENILQLENSSKCCVVVEIKPVKTITK